MKAHLDNSLFSTPRRRRVRGKHRSSSLPAVREPVEFKRILVPVDFTAGSDRALRHAAAIGRIYHGRVLPLHVTVPICFTTDCGYGPVNREVPNAASLRRRRAQLQRLVHRIVPKELAETVIVQSGEPIEQIKIAAKEWKSDLVIMLAHNALDGASPPKHTVDRLVREIRCPVLLLHPPTSSRKR